MGAKCYKSKRDDSPISVTADDSAHSPLFVALLNDPHRARDYPMISEGAARTLYSWQPPSFPGSHNSFFGEHSKTGQAVVVTEMTASTPFTTVQRDALYAMCRYKAPECANTGAVHCAQLDRVFLLGDKLWLVSELKRGCSLRDAVHQAENYDEATALFWFADIAQAVLSLHQAGLVQGELDLQALRVYDSEETTSRVQVPCFNLCKLEARPRESQAWAGATAPELLLDEVPHPNEATDVWNMGVILHTLLVGEPPLNKDTEETKRIILKRREQDEGKVNIADFGGWGRIDAATQDLVVDMLRLSPEHRLTAQQVFNEIEHIIHRLPCSPGQGEALDVKIL